jgi:phosphatidylinositol alpha-mannosyltransferase
VYCAPNTGGESFGIVLVEAMAAGTAVVATDLDAFRRVLEDGTAGRLVPVYDSEALAATLIEVLRDDVARGQLVEAAAEAVRRYDWSVVARQILQVYETVAGAGAKVHVAGSAGRSEATRGIDAAGRSEATRGIDPAGKTETAGGLA